MLTIQVGGTESYDNSKEEFVVVDSTSLNLEHSLLSLSKWESIYQKPFLTKDEKSSEEVLAYVRCMCLDEKVSSEVLQELSEKNFEVINSYIESKQTATTFSELPGASKTPQEVVTSELIYYWMSAFNIPFECERWHLNRLFTLIRVCNIKQGKQKKMSRGEIARRNREINARRKAQLGTTG